MWEMSELGIDELLDLLATVIPELTERPGDDLHYKFMLGRDLLGDVTFEILAPARHFVIRQIAAALLLWRVRFRDAALKVLQAAFDLGLQRLLMLCVGCARHGVPAV
jgi:hypothetical protein